MRDETVPAARPQPPVQDHHLACGAADVQSRNDPHDTE